MVQKSSHLVMAYSASPEWRCTAANVPIQPRRCRSRPIFHVTNSGLTDTHQKHSFYHNNQCPWYHYISVFDSYLSGSVLTRVKQPWTSANLLHIQATYPVFLPLPGW